MRLISTLFALALIGIGVMFTLLNAGHITVHYFIGQAQMPLAAFAFIIIVFSVFLSLCILGVPLIKARAQNKQLRRRLEKTEHQLHTCRAELVEER